MSGFGLRVVGGRLLLWVGERLRLVWVAFGLVVVSRGSVCGGILGTVVYRKGFVVHARTGDRLVVHGKVVGVHDRELEVVEVMGADGGPPYRVRDGVGHETIMHPGPDCVVLPRGASE